MSKEDIIENLRLVLADSYALYLKTQNYHWNVTGNNFFELHKLFESQYKDLAEAIDEIAERIRSLDAKVVSTFSSFDLLTQITDADENSDFEKMLEELTQDNLTVVDAFKKLQNKANKIDDSSTEDLAVRRIVVHEKNAWMLRSSQK